MCSATNRGLKMKYQIKHRYTDSVLFECDVPDTVKSGMAARHSLEKAVAANANLSSAYLNGADLSGANLSGAYLSGAYLNGANLRDANLSGAYLSDDKKLTGLRPFLSIGPIGSRCDYLSAFITDAGVMIRAGCFFDTRAKFEAALIAEHGNNDHAREYLAALTLIDCHSGIWTPKVEVATAEEVPA